MTGKTLIGMALALAVLAGIVIIQSQSGNKQDTHKGADETLFLGLDLNSVDKMLIQEDSEKVVLSKKDGKWKVESLFGYPADFEKLADALRTASDVKTGPALRTSRIDADEYGFDKATVVSLESAGKEVKKVEIGARRNASDAAGWSSQRFIRKDGNEEIYLVDYDFRPFSAKSSDWINKQLINVPASDIVSVKKGDMELKEIAGTWKLTGLDEKTQDLQSGEANRLRSALQYLNCVTIAGPDSAFTNVAVYTAWTTNKSYTVSIGGETDSGRYVQLSGDVPEDLTQWTYIVSTYIADRFLVTRDELVKNKETPEAEPAAMDEAGSRLNPSPQNQIQ